MKTKDGGYGALCLPETGEKPGFGMQRWALLEFWIWNREAGAKGCWAGANLSWFLAACSLDPGRKRKHLRRNCWIGIGFGWQKIVLGTTLSELITKTTVNSKVVGPLEQACWALVTQMTLGKFFHLSEPQFHHMWIGNNNRMYLKELVWRWTYISQVKLFKQYLVHSKFSVLVIFVGYSLLQN